MSRRSNRRAGDSVRAWGGRCGMARECALPQEDNSQSDYGIDVHSKIQVVSVITKIV